MDYFVRLLTGKADTHPKRTSQQRGCLLNTVVGYHGNQRVGMALSNVFGCCSEVLSVRQWISLVPRGTLTEPRQSAVDAGVDLQDVATQ